MEQTPRRAFRSTTWSPKLQAKILTTLRSRHGSGAGPRTNQGSRSSKCRLQRGVTGGDKWTKRGRGRCRSIEHRSDAVLHLETLIVRKQACDLASQDAVLALDPHDGSRDFGEIF